MKHKIYYSMESRRDLNEIREYIASELQNTSAAERVVTDILDTVQQLEDFAELGPCPPPPMWRAVFGFSLRGIILLFVG